ncbi:phenol hydroxylase [mine drainage metagenome]|uniref:Phenol hydroxylase n=1 Tax=mine drainage metagenome TaxID=410659 RepID=T1BFE6_9ZZZZ
MTHEHIKLTLVERRWVTPRVLELTFVRTDGEIFAYIPGQFMTLHLDTSDGEIRRSYSIASLEGEPDRIAIAVTQVEGGRATEILNRIEPRDRVRATGPFGRFVLREDSGMDYLLAATGTGVSPYRAMLRLLEKRLSTSGCEIRLLLGVRSPEELLYGEDFLALVRRQPRFHFEACLSRSLSDPPAAHERRGYVQEILKQLPLDPARHIVYLCGNPDMIDASLNHLKGLGFELPSIRREKYLSSN